MDQLSSLYVASLFLMLIGVVVFVHALLTYGLRWVGRRAAAVWRGRSRRGPGDRDPIAAVEGEPGPGGGQSERSLAAR